VFGLLLFLLFMLCFASFYIGEEISILEAEFILCVSVALFVFWVILFLFIAQLLLWFNWSS
jgi:hypothetical protein